MPVCLSATGFPSAQPAGPSFTPLILATPVIGQPLNYTTPGYAGPVTGQQWYWNTGSGPVLIPGATGATYTPSLTSARGGASDVGGFPSVAVITPFGTYRSQEFAASSQVIAQTGVLTKASPTSGTNFIATEATTITILTVCIVRLVCPLGPNPTFYIETTVAPGTYTGGVGNFGDPTLLGGSQFSCNVYSYLSLAPAACVDQVAARAATATRPAASTGVGFFTKSGALYDANGHRFDGRGINRLHWDCNRPGNDTGLFNAEANIHRLFVDTSQNWATVNQPLVDAMISHSVVPQLVIPYVRANFQASFSGTTMTVTAMNSGVIGCAAAFSSGAGGGFISTGVSSTTVIKAQLTNTNPSGIPGKEGTYTTSTTNNIATPQNVVYSNGTTGQTAPDFAVAAAQVWVDNYSNFGPYERWMLLNIINEWGASAGTYTASFSGTTMTVPSSSASVYLNQRINGTGVTPCKVVQFLTGTGHNGTYQVDVDQGTLGNTTMTDVTWRDTNITMVQMLRTAGYKGTIVLDAPGSGQDAPSAGRAWTIINHAAAIQSADPQQNILVELHVYGSYPAGWLAATAQALATASTSSGIPYCIGEFGPANQNAASGSISTAQTLETVSVSFACRLGWKYWAWDDPVNATNTTTIYYAACLKANSNWFSTSDPAELTAAGRQLLLDSTYGLTFITVPATIFP